MGWAPKGENKPATGNDDATKSTAGSEAYMIPCAPCAVFRHARGSRETPRRPGKRVRSQRRAAAPARFAGRLHAGAPLEGSGQLAPAWTPCSITAPCATPPSPRPAAAARRSRERAARRTTPRRMAFWHRGVPRVECGVCERSAPLSAPHVRAALALHLRLTCAAPRGWPARRGGQPQAPAVLASVPQQLNIIWSIFGLHIFSAWPHIIL